MISCVGAVLRRCMSKRTNALKLFFSGLIYVGLQWVVSWFAPKPASNSFPPVRHNIIKESGVKIAQMIRSKEITSVEVVQIYINRIKEVQQTNSMKICINIPVNCF